MDRLPNVIYMHSHDTGRRVSPYGYAVHTPNLARFACESVLFRNAFCCAPTCSPSRAGLLTGQAAHSSGMLGLHHRGFRLNDPKQHLCHTLRNAGYSTTLVGVNHIVADVGEAGYDRSVKLPSNNAVHVGPAAAEFLRSSPAGPFFLDVGFVETHRGQFPTRHPEENPNYLRPPPGLPDLPAIREDAALFNSAARLFDEGVGRVLDALADTGLDRETLVICTTDHGISFPRHKCTLFDGGLEVMLMLRGPATAGIPGGLPQGTVCDALVSQIDLFPTLFQYLGIARPSWLQGVDLLPLLTGEASSVRDEVYGEITYHAAYQPERAVRTTRYKYIRRFHDDERPQPLSNLDDGLSKSVWYDHGYATHRQPCAALYDLIFDPAEQNNLIRDPKHEAIAAALAQKLGRWMVDTHDPLLGGSVPLPPGAVANLESDYSAKAVICR